MATNDANPSLGRDTQHDSLADCYINFVRVSLAVAIIKNKPAGQDGKAYAVHLQKQIEDLQKDWKWRYLQIKDELLRFKQIQALSDVTNGAKASSLQVSAADVLTPPQTQDSLSSTAAEPQAQCDVMEKTTTAIGEVVDSVSLFRKLSSHHVFLSRIAAMKDFTTGSLVICNSAAVTVVIDTFRDCLAAVRNSLLPAANGTEYTRVQLDVETVGMRRQLISCMVELLTISAGVSRCCEVQRDLNDLYDKCIQAILSPDVAQPMTIQTGMNDEACRALTVFAKYVPSADYISKSIMRNVIDLTKMLVTAKFTTFIKHPSLLTRVENIPKATNLLLTLNQERQEDGSRLLSLLELMKLRENLDRTLAKFPLYTIHIRELLTRTGHKLPLDNMLLD